MNKSISWNNNKVEKDNMIVLQMEQWSVLSNIVNYVQYNRHPRNLWFRY